MNVVAKDETMATAPNTVKKQFGRPRKALDPLMKKWYDRPSVRNTNSAETYVRYVRVSLEELFNS